MSRSAAISVDPAVCRPVRAGVVGRAVREALAEGVGLAGSGRLLAPVLVQLADAVDTAARAGDLDRVEGLSRRFEEMVDRLGLDAGSVSAGVNPLTIQERAVAAARGGPQ